MQLITGLSATLENLLSSLTETLLEAVQNVCRFTGHYLVPRRR